MTLNANEVKGKTREYHPMDPGTYPARLVAVIDLGLQAQRPYNGQAKDPVREIALTYECVDEFMQDEDGQPDPKRPRWVTETFPFYNLQADKAKSTIRYKILDPDMKKNGDFAALVETPVMLTVVHNVTTQGKNKGRIWENVGGVSLPRPKDAEKMEPLVNPTIVFDLDAPDMETWKRIPKFLRDKIESNLEFESSELAKLLKNAEPEPKKEEKKVATKPTKKVVEDDEEPPY